MFGAALARRRRRRGDDVAQPGCGPRRSGDFRRRFPRDEVAALARDLNERAAAACRRALVEARLAPGAIDAVLAIGGASRAPFVRSAIASAFGREPEPRVHVEETVALGAALEAALLDGRVADLALVDRAPHTIGVRGASDRFVPLIRKGAAIPTRVRKVVATTDDDQASLAIDIYHGDASTASSNRHLGRYHISELPRGARGEVHVELGFTLDASGCFSLTASDIETGHPLAVAVGQASRSAARR